MMDSETKNYIDQKIRDHLHDGNLAQRVNFLDLFGNISSFNVQSATIATTGNTDIYVMAPFAGNVVQVDFTALVALAASDANYITWTVRNVSTGLEMLEVLPAGINTTKTTGGAAVAAETKKPFTVVKSSPVNTLLKQGDWVRIRAAVTGTLANTVTFPTYLVQVDIT